MSSSSIGQAGEFLYRAGGGAPLGFGCAGLMRLPTRRRRQRLLAEVFEAGIRHFDVARMYGMGAAEGELGRFARGRRERISIATKFGIDPGRAGHLARLQAPARAALARLPALRASLKRRDGAFHAPRSYDSAGARASLETSLRALGTDHVDVFFVHDPGPGDAVATAELGATMEELRRSGKIRAWGFSGEPGPCLALGEAAGAGAVLQIHDDVFAGEEPARVAAAIAFGVVATPLRRIQGHLAADPERRAGWSRALGVDCADAGAIGALLLRDALDRHPDGGVLFSTESPARVRAVSEIAGRVAGGAERETLDAFRELVRVELREGVAAGV
jgi:D-threo-aldose 1-dehydrogenase